MQIDFMRDLDCRNRLCIFCAYSIIFKGNYCKDILLSMQKEDKDYQSITQSKWYAHSFSLITDIHKHMPLNIISASSTLN